ncbi:uncharacterized protein GGS25DRAFT_470959 [Hypoxylon fragiforme]|uniref:uncharacterized protein n=1 Tax=Hypoxylon fragiforme TaxID=63214 RepID=UPI0020C5B69B|nr:uncharacterized protein GGS25DRAFT_470959 [Hypoxylon fragiforme]KAI2614258.1 hypothetical protein GGS25DRAFT_470959 [Hypoxylon fragiforme]
MPAIDTQLIAREFPLLVARGMSHMSVIAKREVDHKAVETFLVAFTCIFGIGGWIFWMVRQK